MATFQGTLQNLRKRKFKTIKAFSEAYGCSASKAGQILRGLHHMTLSKDDVKYLAHVLGISFVECADACDNTYAELKHYKGDAWKKTPRTHKGIWARWAWEEEIQRDTKKAYDSGDWAEYRRKYTYNYSSNNRHTRTTPTKENCYSVLGIPSTASIDQIKNAFRMKVKAAYDGKGGYNGDMDKLVQAKEQALAKAVTK